MRESLVLTPHAGVNLGLGVLLLLFPRDVVSILEVPVSGSSFYPSVLALFLLASAPHCFCNVSEAPPPCDRIRYRGRHNDQYVRGRYARGMAHTWRPRHCRPRLCFPVGCCPCCPECGRSRDTAMYRTGWRKVESLVTV